MPPPKYGWNVGAARYVNRVTGRFVSRFAVGSAMDAVMLRGEGEATAISVLLRSGQIPLEEWQQRMMTLSGNVHWSAAMVAAGGRNQLQHGDRAFLQEQLTYQYRYLNRFAKDIENGLPLDGRFMNRTKMYVGAGRTTYNVVDRIRQRRAGAYMEHNVMSPVDHCTGCVHQSSKGWVPVGILKPVGTRTCLANCKCHIEYLYRTKKQKNIGRAIKLALALMHARSAVRVARLMYRIVGRGSYDAAVFLGELRRRAVQRRAEREAADLEIPEEQETVVVSTRPTTPEEQLDRLVDVEGMEVIVRNKPLLLVENVDEARENLEKVIKEEAEALRLLRSENRSLAQLPEDPSPGMFPFKQRTPEELFSVDFFESDWTKKWNKWEEGLTPDERGAITAYQYEWDSSMNAYLRGETPFEVKSRVRAILGAFADDSDVDAGYAAVVRNVRQMRLAIMKGVVSENVIAFRGVRQVPGIVDDLVGGKLRPGDVFAKDRGFVSMSLSEPRSLYFAGESTSSVQMEIRVPMGTRGAFIDAVSPGSESELVLAPGTTLRFLEYKGEVDGVHRVVVQVDGGNEDSFVRLPRGEPDWPTVEEVYEESLKITWREVTYSRMSGRFDRFFIKVTDFDGVVEEYAWRMAKVLDVDRWVLPVKVYDDVISRPPVRGQGHSGAVSTFIDGEIMGTAVERGRALSAEQKLVIFAMTDDDAERFALFEYVINDMDRHGGNYIIRRDGGLVGIDYEKSFWEGTDPIAYQYSVFMRTYWNTEEIKNIEVSAGSLQGILDRYNGVLALGIPEERMEGVRWRFARIAAVLDDHRKSGTPIPWGKLDVEPLLKDPVPTFNDMARAYLDEGLDITDEAGLDDYIRRIAKGSRAFSARQLEFDPVDLDTFDVLKKEWVPDPKIYTPVEIEAMEKWDRKEGWYRLIQWYLEDDDISEMQADIQKFIGRMGFTGDDALAAGFTAQEILDDKVDWDDVSKFVQKRVTKAVPRYTKALKKAVSKSQVPRDMVVYRGAPDPGRLKVGDILADDLFSAATLDENHARGYTRAIATDASGKNTPYGGVLYQIEVPKGSKALLLDAVIPREMKGPAEDFGTQWEVLFPPNTRYEVLDITEVVERTGYTHRIVQVRVVNEVTDTRGGSFVRLPPDPPGYFPPFRSMANPTPDEIRVRWEPTMKAPMAPDEVKAAEVYAGFERYTVINKVMRGVDEQKIIDEYVEYWSIVDNDYTADHLDDLEFRAITEIADAKATVIPNMRKAIDKGVVPEDIVVYRGVEFDPKLGVGDDWVDNAFVSTSLDRKHAEIIYGDSLETGEAALYEIRLRSGMRGALSIDGADVQLPVFPQKEVILQAGTKLRVLEIIDSPRGVHPRLPWFKNYQPPRRYVMEVVDADYEPPSVANRPSFAMMPRDKLTRQLHSEDDEIAIFKYHAEAGNHVGSVMLAKIDEKRYRVHSIGIWPGDRRKGYASRIYADLVEMADERGIVIYTFVEDLTIEGLALLDARVAAGMVGPEIDMGGKAVRQLLRYKGDRPTGDSAPIVYPRGLLKRRSAGINSRLRIYQYLDANGDVVAGVTLNTETGDWIIELIQVPEDFRRMGVGSRVYDDLARLAEEENVRILTTTEDLTDQGRQLAVYRESLGMLGPEEKLPSLSSKTYRQILPLGEDPAPIVYPRGLLRRELYGSADEDSRQYHYYNEKGQVVASVFLNTKTDRWLVDSIEVLGTFRRKGIATRVYDDLAKLAEEEGVGVYTIPDDLTGQGQQLAVYREGLGMMGPAEGRVVDGMFRVFRQILPLNEDPARVVYPAGMLKRTSTGGSSDLRFYSYTNEKGEKVGSVTLNTETEIWTVDLIQVLPSFRRQGIAARIYDDLAKFAAEEDARIYTVNETLTRQGNELARYREALGMLGPEEKLAINPFRTYRQILPLKVDSEGINKDTIPRTLLSDDNEWARDLEERIVSTKPGGEHFVEYENKKGEAVGNASVRLEGAGTDKKWVVEVGLAGWKDELLPMRYIYSDLAVMAAERGKEYYVSALDLPGDLRDALKQVSIIGEAVDDGKYYKLSPRVEPHSAIVYPPNLLKRERATETLSGLSAEQSAVWRVYQYVNEDGDIVANVHLNTGGGDVWTINLIEVDEYFQRQGIATRIYDDLARHAEEEGVRIFTVESDLTRQGRNLAAYREALEMLGPDEFPDPDYPGISYRQILPLKIDPEGIDFDPPAIPSTDYERYVITETKGKEYTVRYDDEDGDEVGTATVVLTGKGADKKFVVDVEVSYHDEGLDIYQFMYGDLADMADEFENDFYVEAARLDEILRDRLRDASIIGEAVDDGKYYKLILPNVSDRPSVFVPGLPLGIQLPPRIVAKLNGRFYVIAKLRKRSDYGTVYELDIQPRFEPNTGVSYEGRSFSTYYDEGIADLVDERVVLKPDSGYSMEVDYVPEDDVMYRGISQAELDSIIATGKIQSSGDYNIVDSQIGKTSFAIDPRTAQSYAGGFAPWHLQPTFQERGYILKVRRNGRPASKWTQGEIDSDPVDASDILDIAEVRALTMSSGKFDIAPGRYYGDFTETGDQYVLGSGSAPNGTFVHRRIGLDILNKKPLDPTSAPEAFVRRSEEWEAFRARAADALLEWQTTHSAGALRRLREAREKLHDALPGLKHPIGPRARRAVRQNKEMVERFWGKLRTDTPQKVKRDIARLERLWFKARRDLVDLRAKGAQQAVATMEALAQRYRSAVKAIRARWADRGDIPTLPVVNKDNDVVEPGDAPLQELAHKNNGQAKTVEEAVEHARAMGVEPIIDQPLPVDELEFFNAINVQIADAKRRGHPIPDYLRFRDMGVDYQDAGAVYYHLSSIIEINTGSTIWLNGVTGMKSLMRQAKFINWFSTDDLHHMINHELGHMAHFRFSTDVYMRNRDLTALEIILAHQVGDYSRTDAREFVTETYVGLLFGKQYSKEVMDLYKDLEGPPIDNRR